MNKLYSRIVWENFPSEKTALNESNLNRMDLAIDNIDNRVIEMDSTKVNKEVANNLVKTWSIDEETGIITVEHLDGSKDLFDLNIEKIPVNFELSDNGILTMTTDDGTQYTANIGAMIPVLTFEDSDEIAVSVTGTGVNKTYSFSIKSGSVTEDKLQPNFLADVKTEVAKAQASQSAAAQSASAASGSATLAESYTHGGTGAREGEETDNAKYYMEQAKAVSAVDIATTEKAGIVKPDGTTITVDPDGTIHGSSSVDLSGYYNNANYDTNKNVLQLMHDDKVLIELKISGGGTKIAPKDTVDPAILNGNAKVTISWGDPGDVIIDGIVLSAWKGTKLVMKESGYPENENDGTLILDNTVRDAYKTSGYVVDGLTNGNTYYFALFPYSMDGVYNYSASNRLLGNPSLVKLDSCTNMQISAAMGSVTVTWDDPDATKTVDGNTATWAKTVLVYKQGSVAPNSPADGTIAVTETTRNQYASVGYEVTGLTDGEQYTFSLFAVSTDETSSDAVSATAKLWATLTVNTTEDTLFGKTVTATNEVKTVSGTFSDSGSATLQIPWIGLTTVTSTDGTDTADDTVDVTAYMATYSTQITFIPDGETVTPIDDVSILLKCAGIKDKNYTTMEEVLADDEVMSDITIDENSMKYLARSTGFADAVCANETFMTLLGQSAYVDATVLNSDLWVTKIKASPYKWLVLEKPVYPFSTASDTDLAKMLDAYYSGDITIDDIKTKNSVGDTRSVSLSAMEATGVGESHRAQTVEFVIGDFEHDDLTTAINGHTKAAITLLQKDCLMDATNESNPVNGQNNTENGYMNSSNTNSGGWKSCARRTWCNNVYLSALPSAWRSMVKTVNKKVSVGNKSSTIETVQDKIFLAAEIEIFGSTTYSVSGEGTQYQYYKNATANRYKMPRWGSDSSYVSNFYWYRSPYSGNTASFCRVNFYGNTDYNNASNAGGVAPCLCI